MAIRIGCGSWSDDEYVGLISPAGTPPAQRLREYGRVFEVVEVNSSFYRTPRRAMVKNWVEQTPPGFLFDIKLHRNLLSSISKGRSKPGAGKGPKASVKSTGAAKPGQDLLAFMLGEIQPLIKARRLGAFLLLLPPYFGPEKHGLAELDILVDRIKPYPLAVEFRNSAWVGASNRSNTLAYFKERGITWVAVDMPRLEHPSIMPPIDEVTQPKLAYLRLHGRNRAYPEAKSAEERHTYLYRPGELKEIVARIRRLAAQASEVRVIANNHAKDFAPRTALALKKLLGQAAGRTAGS